MYKKYFSLVAFTLLFFVFVFLLAFLFRPSLQFPDDLCKSAIYDYASCLQDWSISCNKKLEPVYAIDSCSEMSFGCEAYASYFSKENKNFDIFYYRKQCVVDFVDENKTVEELYDSLFLAMQRHDPNFVCSDILQKNTCEEWMICTNRGTCIVDPYPELSGLSIVP